MKTTKIYSIAFATLLLMPVLLKAQWHIVRWDKVNDLRKVTAIDSSHAFVLGYDFILRTNDGGNTWDSIPVSPQQNSFFSYDMIFPDKDNGFITGVKYPSQTAFLLKTTDNGNTWTEVLNPTSPYYSSSFFIDSQTGYITDLYTRTLYKTLDGGSTWTSEKFSFYVNNVCFLDQNNGFVSGYDTTAGNPGVVMKTSDGGITWNTVLNTPEPMTGKLDFVDANTVFASNTNKIFRAKDGGNSWDTLNIPLQINGSIVDFTFTSLDNGHLMTISYGGFGVPDTTNLYRTTDGGNSWIWEYSAEALSGYSGSSGYYLNSFSFTDNTGFVAGTNGVIKKYTSTTTGIKEEKSNGTVSVYPNPLTTKAIISIASELKNGLLTIYDLSGKEVKNINFSGKQVIVERGNLESGVYFLNIKTDKEFFMEKIIIQK